jgi:WD40 repeat protein/tRNA A-37 threonylcarbamoyl transferase component Bud32
MPPLDQQRHVDHICDRFEAAWKASRASGPRPRLEDYLAQAPLAGGGAVLLRELVLIDVYYRLRSGDAPRQDEYRCRFPDLDPQWLAAAAGLTLAQAPAEPVPPRRVGGYEVLEELGRGGMSVVYKARQTQPNRLVALKMILAGRHLDPARRARLLAEADAIARLRHPHIVQIYAAGEHDGLPFLALELVSGGSLAEKQGGSPLPARRAAALVETLACAIQHSHEHGVVHRDLKPANVLLTGEGQPKITDFGLARHERPELTATGAVLGTPSYMAPEQAGGDNRAVGPAADVYGLGAILYELLTGRPPFQGPTALETLQQVVSQEPVAPSRLQGWTPRDLETICLKCLSKEPQRRYASAAALAEDLKRFLAGEPIRARAVGPGKRLLLWARRRPTLAAVHVLLLLVVTLGGLGGGALWLWQRAEDAKQQAEDALRAKAAAQETLDQVLYLRNVDLAYREWQESGLTLAEQLLAGCPPARRHWEWHYLHRLLHGELLAFRPDHVGSGWPDCLAYSPDGTCLAGACRGLEVPVWDARTGRETFTLGPNPGPVYAVAFSPDGTRLASAGGASASQAGPSPIYLWDTRTRKQVRVLEGHTASVVGVAFSPDGKHLASASDDDTVRVWDVSVSTEGRPAGGRQALVLQGRTREGRPERALGVAFSRDGTRLASTGVRVHVWDADSGQEVLTLEGPDGWGVFNSVAFSPDGTRLAGAGPDKAVLVWDARTGRQVLALSGHTRPAVAVAFSPDGTHLATASKDNTVRVWDAATGEETFCLRGHRDAVRCLAFSPDGTRLASGGLDRSVRVWDLMTGPGPLLLRGHTGAAGSVAFSPDGARLASCGVDGTVRTWNARTGQALLAVQGHTKSACGVAFDGRGARLASAGNDQMVRVWDAASGKELLALRGPTADLTEVAFSPDGARLARAGRDGVVRVWDAQTGAEVFNLRGHGGFGADVTFSPDGTRLASASTDGSVRLWEAATGKELLVLDGHKGGVLHVAFSPDGRRLAAGCGDHDVQIWEADTGRAIRTLTGHRDSLIAVAFSPDGQRLASTSADGTLRLWDTTTGQQALTLTGGSKGVNGVAFSPDGRRLAAGCKDGVVRVWDASPTE